MSKKYAAVLVFGDLGRSPRMMNHALEIAQNTDYNVYFIGYLGKPKLAIFKINFD